MGNKKKIIVGSKNNSKVDAVDEILKEYSHLADHIVDSLEVSSMVSDQPLSLEETIKGACNRAKEAFGDCNFSIGLEAGLMCVPMSKTGYMDFCACAIYDGNEFHIGLSSMWEFPDKRFTELILQGKDMTQAVNMLGLSNDPNVGSKEGAIGILTKGRLTRKEYTKQALRTALIHLDNPKICKS